MQVIFLELWLLRVSIVLLPISTCFFFYVHKGVFIKPIDESIGFQDFCIYVETNKLILTKNYMTGFCIDSRSVESVRFNGYIGKIWITEFSIVLLFVLLFL